ncbi:MAG: deoxyribodipyrimidine photolyase [Myxococcota bacterium]|nr:deoxyribodipyrimidine photolyase [Myxococcota bacterium]
MQQPLVVLEGLGLRYPHASARHHRFILDGMADTARQLADRHVTMLSHVARHPGSGQGLLHTLGEHASAVVSDLTSIPLLRRLAAQAARLPCRVDLVDSVGLHPFSASDRHFPTAHAFRRHLHRTLPALLAGAPHPDPTQTIHRGAEPDLPDLSRWQFETPETLVALGRALADLPIDHSVPPVDEPGGEVAAQARWRTFLVDGLPGYADGRNHPDADTASGLSPYLHHGHISTHQMLADIGEAYGWDPGVLEPGGRGSRTGWWGLPAGPEAYLDQVVTWRELGQLFSWHVPDAHEWETLPDWARKTLDVHATDPRPETYDRATLEAGETRDRIWNAAQRQLVETGRMHNYLRMLWGKKVLQWSASPQEAFQTLLYLNDKYALDGRDPNSIAGVGWVFGRFDRAWGPERPVFGKTRYMTSASTERKLRLKDYLARWAPEAPAP